MEQEIKSNEEQKAKLSASENVYELLSSLGEGHDLTIRDDQYDFPTLLDAIKLCRRRGLRFRLVDSGLLDRFQLEWLLTAGADFYTSDEVPRELQELEALQKSCQKGNSILAFFIHKELEFSSESGTSSFSGLLGLGRSGIYIHITNRETKRDLTLLGRLAEECRTGGSRLIYYHHGLLDPALEELGRKGVWIHMSDKNLQGKEDLLLLMDILPALHSAGTNLVLYLERGMDYLALKEIVEAQVLVLFKRSQIDYRSPLKKLERSAARKKLDYRAYYLYSTFLP